MPDKTSEQGAGRKNRVRSSTKVAEIDLHAPGNILVGLISDRECARQLGCSIRSIDRYRVAGMPTIILGKKVLFDPAAVREWVVRNQRE